MNLISTNKNNKQFDFHPAFSQDLLCHSDTACKHGINNACPDELLTNLSRLSHLLGQVQACIGPFPIKINSGYRCEILNQKVGGVANSQHCQGLAADIVCPQFGSARQLAKAIVQSHIQYDQLILEFDRWVHLSIPANQAKARRESLTLTKDRGYEEGIE